VRLHEDKARGRWIVMAPERMFVPDETALAVLRLVDGTRDEAAITAALAAQYDAPPDVIGEDVRALIADLVGRGALREA
jgi:pyrroloquinoline quinone biosynthesis protein D